MTGGRDYSDRRTVEHTLMLAAQQLGEPGPGMVTLVHGDCKRYRSDGTVDPDRSADQLAAQTARSMGWHVEPHGVTDAEYRRYGKRIFSDRNQEMVDLGADICVVYPGGAGTADCQRRARRAGIECLIAQPVPPDRC